MEKRLKLSNKLLVIIFIIAVILSVIATYFSVYANSAESYSNPDYKSLSVGAPEEAHVGVIVEEREIDNGS